MAEKESASGVFENVTNLGAKLINIEGAKKFAAWYIDTAEKVANQCQSDACGSCMCTLEAGEVHLRHNQVLDSNDLKQGWILACQAIADSASVRVRFPD